MSARGNRLLCDDCGEEIFADVNMVMLADPLWDLVCDGRHGDAYCDRCIERRLGRPIAPADFKPSDGHLGLPHVVCNLMWLHGRDPEEAARLLGPV